MKQHAPEHLQHAWFSSPGFAFYGVQRELLVGSYSSLVASLGIALLVLFLTSGNLFIAFYALITITFAIGNEFLSIDVTRSIEVMISVLLAVSVAIFAALKWELGIVEAIIVIMSVGLSVDFVVHFGVGYIHTNSTNIEHQRKKIQDRARSASNQSTANDETPSHPSNESSSSMMKTNVLRCLFRNTSVPSVVQRTSGWTRDTRPRVDHSRRFSCVHGRFYHFCSRILNDALFIELVSANGTVSDDHQYVSNPIVHATDLPFLSSSDDVMVVRYILLLAALCDRWPGG